MISDDSVTDPSYCELPKIIFRIQHTRLIGIFSCLTKVFVSIEENEQTRENAMAFLLTPKNTGL
jgi:hypothetical protein